MGAPDIVRMKLLAAAADLYTAGRTYSVRAVATHAGVNHGQVHHLFGGKPGLTDAMLEFLGDEVLDRIRAVADLDDPLAALGAAAEVATTGDARFARALARYLTEQEDPDVGQSRFPVVSALLQRLELLDPAVRPIARVYVAEHLARALGWALFSPWIRKATQLGDDELPLLETCLRAIPPEVTAWLQQTPKR